MAGGTDAGFRSMGGRPGSATAELTHSKELL